MASRNSGRRGFASMDPEGRREMGRRGGQASYGGRGYQEEYDEDYDRDEDYDEGPRSRYNEYESEEDYDDDYDEDYDEEDEDEYNRPYSRYDEQEERGWGGRGYREDQGRRSDYDRQEYGRGDYGYGQGNERGRSSNYGSRGDRRGFASMDPDRQREIASEGGRAYHERRGRSGHDQGGSSSRGRNSNSDRGHSGSGRSSSSGRGNYSFGRSSSSGRGSSSSGQQRNSRGQFTSRSGRSGYGSRGRSSRNY